MNIYTPVKKFDYLGKNEIVNSNLHLHLSDYLADKQLQTLLIIVYVLKNE